MLNHKQQDENPGCAAALIYLALFVLGFYLLFSALSGML